MSCLTHNKRFRALLHNVINELRSENRTPVHILHTMPRRCCTCHEEVVETPTLNEYNAFTKLDQLIEKVIREKEPNARLILSLNRLGSLIKEHRVPPPPLTASPDQSEDSISFPTGPDGATIKKISYDSSTSNSSSSSDDEDHGPMIVQRPVKGKPRATRASKPLKSGTFVFLPYAANDAKAKGRQDTLLEVAKLTQRRRFLSARGHIPQLEKEYHVRINMITPKTSRQVTDALKNAQQALGNLTIYGKSEAEKATSKSDGEWVLVRQKNVPGPAATDDVDRAIRELTDRWTSCLSIRKRSAEDTTNPRREKRRARHNVIC